MHPPPEGVSGAGAAAPVPLPRASAEPSSTALGIGVRPAGDASEGATSRGDLDRAASGLADRARAFARMPPAEKAALLAALVGRWMEVAPEQVALGCRAKGILESDEAAGEEWLAGSYPIVQNLRLLADALGDIAKTSRPSLARTGRPRLRSDGRVEVPVLPRRGPEAMLLRGIRASALLAPGVSVGDVAALQAPFYQQREPEGGVSLVLGGGNVASIPVMDAIHRLFVAGRVVLLKMSPVNAYLGPLIERAFAPLVDAGYLRVVYGGADVGAALCAHPAVADIHVTGSHATHDAIVWGPPGPEREARKARGAPLFTKPITSELGNVSPVVVVPYLYAADELWYQARSVASQLVNNGSFNCNAAKLAIVSRSWPQRELFLELVTRALSGVRPRLAYYPGAVDRYRTLVDGRAHVAAIGEARPGYLPWTVVPDLDPRDAAEPLYRVEAFCALVGEVALGSSDPAAFLSEAVEFCNERLWGTLNAELIVPHVLEEDPTFSAALDRAILDLRYGTVAINTWPAVAYASVLPPWGGHPSATLADVQSGIGFVHNPLMLERVEKTVLRAPLRAFPKPPFFCDSRTMTAVGARLTAFAANPRWSSALAVASAALRA